MPYDDDDDDDDDDYHPRRQWHCQHFATLFRVKKLEYLGYQTSKKQFDNMTESLLKELYIMLYKMNSDTENQAQNLYTTLMLFVCI